MQADNNDKQSRRSMVFGPETRSYHVFVFAGFILMSGCVMQPYKPEPVSLEVITQQRLTFDHTSPEFKSYLAESNFSTTSWPINQWDVPALTLAAFYFNPGLPVVRSQIDIEEAGIGIAGQRPNPTVNIPLEYHDEPGESPWYLGLVGDFLFERSAKREAREMQAAARRDAAQIAVSQQAWELYTSIHAGMIEYYAAIRKGELLKRQKDILNRSLELLEQRLTYGQASQFELSSLRLELQTTDLQLANQQYLINDAYHQLLSHVGLQVSKFQGADFEFSDLQQHLTASAESLHDLRAELVQQRFDIRQKLAEYDVFEARLKLEIEQQYPDLNLSPGFVFDQGNSVWELGAAWILPLFHNNESQIQQALAQRKQKQLEIIELQTRLLNELDRKRQNYLDKLAAYQNSLQLLDALTNKATQVEKQFELGYSDQLNVLRTKLEIEKANQAIFDIELDVMRAAVKLESLTQSPILTSMQNLNFTIEQDIAGYPK